MIGAAGLVIEEMEVKKEDGLLDVVDVTEPTASSEIGRYVV